MKRPPPPHMMLIMALVAMLAVSACGQAPTSPTAFAQYFADFPGALALDGLTYNQRYNCSQTFTGQPEFCADADASDTIQFTEVAPHTYEARDVPDTGFLYTGTLSGRTFTWTATSPNGYTESGTWVFASDASSFSGTSHYIANDNSYSGDCTETGARSPATPAAPAAIGSCP